MVHISRRWILSVTTLFPLQKFVTNSTKVPKIMKWFELDVNIIALSLKNISRNQTPCNCKSIGTRCSFRAPYLVIVYHTGARKLSIENNTGNYCISCIHHRLPHSYSIYFFQSTSISKDMTFNSMLAMSNTCNTCKTWIWCFQDYQQLSIWAAHVPSCQFTQGQ